MKVLNLRCKSGHDFEGWFANDAAYDSQSSQGLVACPVCGDPHIQRLPTAPRLNLSGAAQADHPQATRAPNQQDLARDIEALWLKTVRHIMAHTEDVGTEFADEARKMHHGEAEQRAIRGQATEDELRSLREEDIDVLSLPLPRTLKETLQ